MKFQEVPKAFGDRVVVKVDKADQTTESGIIITGLHEPFATGTIASVSETLFFDEDEDLNKGDRIVFKNYFADLETFSVGEDKYIFLEYDQVLARL